MGTNGLRKKFRYKNNSRWEVNFQNKLHQMAHLIPELKLKDPKGKHVIDPKKIFSKSAQSFVEFKELKFIIHQSNRTEVKNRSIILRVLSMNLN